MRCYVCDRNDWHIRKDLNSHRPDGLGICKNCGNVTFILKDNYEEELKKHYNQDRTIVGSSNLLTTTRKLNYIKKMLLEYLKDKKDLICCDIGAATGYVCNWLRQYGYKATGTEWGYVFRRFSEHYYGIPLTKEIDTKRKYDLITIYHVLEHLSDPDKKLIQYKSLLNDNGRILISTPIWFYVLENLSLAGKLTSDTYFHSNHINCFSKISLQNVFRKCGLLIEKEDYITYGQTYLLKKADDVTPVDIVKEDWQKINNDIDKILKAIEYFDKRQYREALDIWYNYPQAASFLVFDTYRKEPDRQKAEMDEMFKRLGNDAQPQMYMNMASWLFQRQQYQEAIEWFIKCMHMVPREDVFVQMGLCYFHMNDYLNAIKMFNTAAAINPRTWIDMMDWIGKCCISMPNWEERAEIEIKEKLFKEANMKIEMKDEAMGDKNENSKSTNRDSQELVKES